MINLIRATVFWLTLFVLTSLLFILLLMVYAYHKLLRTGRLSQGAHWVAIVWGKTVIKVTPGWRYNIRGLEHMPREGEAPVVIVANHQSAADIWAIYLTGAQFRWLSKSSVFKLPYIGCAMRWAGYVPIRRGDRGSHTAALRASAEWIRRGVSMVFFPEGTRSEDGKLREFKSGAFRIAMDTQVAVLPMVIRGTKDMMLKGTAIPRPAYLDIDILPKVYPLPAEDLEAFTKRVQTIIAERLEIPVPQLNPEPSFAPISRTSH